LKSCGGFEGEEMNDASTKKKIVLWQWLLIIIVLGVVLGWLLAPYVTAR
jgi:Na+/H+-dicarboxylate symporter